MRTLEGKRIAFTGQLASMTRPEAAKLVSAHGGTFVVSVTRRTSMLVVGQEGWPLQKNGRLSKKLETAQQLQAAGCALAILTEEDLLQRLGLDASATGIHKRFTIAQLGRLLKIPRARLRGWMNAGLLQPVETVQAVCYFDFHQVTGIRTLWELTQRGVKLDSIRRSLEQLAGWLPDLGASLAQLNLLHKDGRMLTRLHDGQLVEPSGQLHFDFEEQDGQQGRDVAICDLITDRSCEHWLTRGRSLELKGHLREAAEVYSQALHALGPDPTICFNLANVLYQLGFMGLAAEYFRQALKLNPEDFEAWNNLGSVLVHLEQADEALDAFRRALAIAPDYGAAHFNLADTLEDVKSFSEARKHWKEFLRHEPMGEWADYARRRLAN